MIVVGQQEGALIIVLGNRGGSRWWEDNERAKERVHFLHSSVPMPEVGARLLHHLQHTEASAIMLEGHMRQNITSRQQLAALHA